MKLTPDTLIGLNLSVFALREIIKELTPPRHEALTMDQDKLRSHAKKFLVYAERILEQEKK